LNKTLYFTNIPARKPRSCVRVPRRIRQESHMKVKDVMHSGATWVDPGTPVSELAKMMRDQDIGSIPIGENDKLVGMVTDRDLVCRGLANGGDCETLTARDVMSK